MFCKKEKGRNCKSEWAKRERERERHKAERKRERMRIRVTECRNESGAAKTWAFLLKKLD